jgi:predicted small metal-binding protein
MKEKMASITCDPSCGFMVRSHDEHEVVDFAKSHVKKAHKMNTSDAELKKMVKRK